MNKKTWGRTTVISSIGLILYTAYYYFNLFVLIKTAEKVFLNDEMTNLTWAHLMRGNVTVQNDISHSQTTVPANNALGLFLRGQIVSLNEAFENGITLNSNHFLMSVESGFPLCKDRIDSDQLLYYNDIAFAICNSTKNIESLSQLLHVGNAHVSLDSLILSETLLANSSNVCDILQNTSYLYPLSYQAINSKNYLALLCLRMKRMSIYAIDDKATRQKKILSVRKYYSFLYNETTISTHLVSSNILQSFNIRMSSSRNYNILNTTSVRFTNHQGMFSYGFGKWKHFSTSLCFHTQKCSLNQKRWIKKSTESNYIRNHVLVNRILNFSSYEKTPVDYFVDLPSYFLPNFDDDLNHIRKLAQRHTISLTELHPKDLNFSMHFTCRQSTVKAYIFNNVYARCSSQVASPASTYPGLSTCSRQCVTRFNSAGLVWALRVIKCIGNDSLIDLITTTTPTLIPLFKKAKRLHKSICDDVVKTMSNLNYDTHIFELYARDTDQNGDNATNVQSDYSKLVKYKNPVQDLIMLSAGQFNSKEIKLRYGNFPGLSTNERMNIHYVLFAHCFFRIALKVESLIHPGRHVRVSIGLTRKKQLYYGLLDVAPVRLIDPLQKIKKSVTVPETLPFYTKRLLGLNIVTTTLYFFILVVNFFAVRQKYFPENIFIIGRISLYLPGRNIIPLCTGIFSLVAIRLLLATSTFLEIASCSSDFYEFIVLHLSTAWILYIVDDYTGNCFTTRRRYSDRALIWIYLLFWSIMSLHYKGKERVVFIMRSERNSIVGTFQVITFKMMEILLDIVTLGCGWLVVKFAWEYKRKDVVIFDRNFVDIYPRLLCNILLSAVYVNRSELIHTSQIDKEHEKRVIDVNFNCCAVSRSLTTVWYNDSSGFDLNLMKWIQLNFKNSKLYIVDYLFLGKSIRNGDRLRILPKTETGKRDASGYLDGKKTVLMKWLTSIGLIVFISYYVFIQFGLLDLVEKVFENDEMSVLSIKEMTSTEILFNQSYKDYQTLNTPASVHKGYLMKHLTLESNLISLEKAISIGFKGRASQLKFYRTAVTPCRLRLLRYLKNETYVRNTWNKILCSNDNLNLHLKFMKQGNFMSATDSMILTQKLIFNSTFFCDTVFWGRLLNYNRYRYVNPYSSASNTSIAYLLDLCNDMRAKKFSKETTIRKYSSIIKEVTISKYFFGRNYEFSFAVGYNISKYYSHFTSNPIVVNQDNSFYGMGPGNWGCCGFRQCFQMEHGCEDGVSLYERTMVRWEYANQEHVSRSNNFSSYNKSVLSFVVGAPAIIFPNLYRDALSVFEKFKSIESNDEVFYKNLSEKTIQSKSTSTLLYPMAGFTKSKCSLFTAKNIDYHLTDLSGCASEKSFLSISEYQGTLTALRILKCIRQDSLIDLLQTSGKISLSFKKFRYPSDKSCLELLELVKRIDWSVSPLLFIRWKNTTSQSDMILAKFPNPIEELYKLKSNTFTQKELQERVGGLAYVSRNDSQSIILFMTLARIQRKVKAILNPGMMHLFQAGVYKNGSLFYGTIPNRAVESTNSFPQYDEELDVSKSYSKFVKFFVSLGIGYSFTYILILLFSVYCRRILMPETVMELGRVMLLFPGGHLIAVSNGLYSVVGIRQFLSTHSFSELTMADFFSLSAMQLGSSWFLYIVDNAVGEILRLPNIMCVRISPWVYIAVHGLLTLPLKKRQTYTLHEKLGMDKGGSTWEYVFEINKFRIMDVIFDIGTLVIGWLLLKVIVICWFRLPKLKFERSFQEIYSTIMCNVLYHNLTDRSLIINHANGLISFAKDANVGLSTLWYSKTKGFDFQSESFVKLTNSEFTSVKKISRKRAKKIKKAQIASNDKDQNSNCTRPKHN